MSVYSRIPGKLTPSPFGVDPCRVSILRTYSRNSSRAGSIHEIVDDFNLSRYLKLSNSTIHLSLFVICVQIRRMSEVDHTCGFAVCQRPQYVCTGTHSSEKVYRKQYNELHIYISYVKRQGEKF